MVLDFGEARVLDALASDREWTTKARFWTATIRFEAEEFARELQVQDGRAVAYSDTRIEAPDVVLRSSEDVWTEFLSPTPKPFLIGLGPARISGVQVGADPVAHRNPFAPALERLVEVLRELTSGPRKTGPIPYPYRDTDVAVGRYVYAEAGGVEYRVYYEEAGEGVPLLLQHTAGADARQWRHVLANPELQQRFRMIAYDLPYHGRSMPPMSGTRWWQEEYAPSRDDLMDRIVGISRALELDRPVFMGCSIGGQLAADLTAFRPADFRALVSINGWLHQEPLAGATNEYFNHPRIWKDAFAANCLGCTTLTAPEPFRRETYWIYASGGPAVYKGDNEYFLFGHDLRGVRDLITEDTPPLWVLAGEYDATLAFPDAGAKALAEHVPGARFYVLPGLSHFMMSDDPVGFCERIVPILDDALAATSVNAGTQ